MEQTPRPNNRVNLQRPNINVNRPTSSPQSGTQPKAPGTSSKKKKKPFPTWGKVLIVAGMLLGSLWFGLIIGYSVVGKRPLGEVFSFSTWKHLFDLIFG